MTIDTHQIRAKFSPAPFSEVGVLCDQLDALGAQIVALECKLLELETHATRANTAVSAYPLDVSPAELAALDAAGRMAGRMAQHHRPRLDAMRADYERLTAQLVGNVAQLDGYDQRAQIKLSANKLVETIRGEWVRAQKSLALALLGHDDVSRPWHTAELRPIIY